MACVDPAERWDLEWGASNVLALIDIKQLVGDIDQTDRAAIVAFTLLRANKRRLYSSGRCVLLPIMTPLSCVFSVSNDGVTLYTHLPTAVDSALDHLL